ncbi:MAG: bifunctional folylpolyglutamate synthase/dihydrofolate synthase [Prolixibacteraceae bacterium]|nr:bifunctional folylpolyglutamate synthase/dihydrofolate synthase [Prolixibacteraceae bacterium]MBT6006736.1 bifunctional folylpolyglutamate synthase/dihydrofolate synthase [Prolixibacteraceae bacterium]MBT6765094.1 bifunctional folylpolyglutamate synthase/dihydrofolate synthase [Prolixibacteraceae bacterium]MBT6997786.1 bifunctional folylpolyglutamate synthase/dihydrofolate synthase [Prolixibacteraceae bacterium]MBT7396426.1 bifunctional folylpolyglutamate synthase/dihydrofolate synthase [Pro
MNYKETIDYLFNKLPMFHRTGPAAYKNSLENIIKLDGFYSNPHKNFKSIHVAGTNGKGSVSHMLAAVLQKAGYKTGLYTSPHLKDFRERIRVNGKMIPMDEVVDWVSRYKTMNKIWNIEPSFFELTVALAFDYFSKQKVDIAIVEVGLGGRLDSTNIISPEISVITNIGFDHTDLLGNTLKKIAIEKAGIIKPEVPVVIGTTQVETKHVFLNAAKKAGSLVYFADQEISVVYSLVDLDGKQVVAIEKRGKKIFPQLKLDLQGFYQRKNLSAVLKVFELMQEMGWQISENDIYNGLANISKSTGLKGRWQVIGNNPLIVCDTGHNQEGIIEVVAQIEQTPFKNLHFVFGLVSDKESEKILGLLPQNATYYFTKANLPRALDDKILAEKAARFGLKGNSYPVVSEAFMAAKNNSQKNDLIVVGGSTFVVAEIL